MHFMQTPTLQAIQKYSTLRPGCLMHYENIYYCCSVFGDCYRTLFGLPMIFCSRGPWMLAIGKLSNDYLRWAIFGSLICSAGLGGGFYDYGFLPASWEVDDLKNLLLRAKSSKSYLLWVIILPPPRAGAVGVEIPGFCNGGGVDF